MFMDPPNENTLSDRVGEMMVILFIVHTPTNTCVRMPEQLLCMTFQPPVQAFITGHKINEKFFTGEIFWCLNFRLVLF